MMTEEKNKGGRPEKTLDEDQIELVSGLSAVLTKGQLADYFGMCENTFREIEARQPEVNEAYKKGRASQIATIAQNLVGKALDGDTSSMMFYLKTQAGWKETSIIQSENKDVKTFSDMYGNTES